MAKDIELTKLENIEVYVVRAYRSNFLDGTAETIKDLADTKLSVLEALVLLGMDAITDDYIFQYIDKETDEPLFIGDLLMEVRDKLGA